jgi:hypothetical protein
MATRILLFLEIGSIVIIHVQKACGLVARTEAHYLGPALARPNPLPMGPCQPDMKGRVVPVQRNQPVGLARHDPLLTASPPPGRQIYITSQPSRRLPETLTHSPCPPP